MDKIKSVLSGHKKTDDAVQDPTGQSASGASQTETPIYNQMANQKDANTHANAEPPHFSNTPNVHQSHPTSANSVTSSGPTNTLRPDAHLSAPADAVSNASIKSGVIGFGPSGEEEHAAKHAALPNKNTAEDHLDPNQILGGGSSGGVTGEQKNIQPTTLPHSGTASHEQHDFAYSNTTANQPSRNSTQHENSTNDAYRSFPLSGGIAPLGSENTSSFARQLEAGSSAPLPQSERRDVQHLAEETREATYGNSGDEPPITEQDRTGLLAGVRPFNKRTDTHPHIPGEFPDPTPTDNPSQTFFNQSSVDTTSKTDVPSVHSELRHTGTLDHPRPKSADFTPDQPRHQGRGAATAGGIGAAGLGASDVSQKYDTSSESPHHVSPYSSTKLDPRVYGKSGPPLEQQKFDSRTKTNPPAQRSLPIRESKDSSTVLAPLESTHEEPKHHYGRDAAAFGAGTAAVGALAGVSQRDHAPDGQHATSGSSVSVPQKPSKASDTSYGASGTPVPRVDNTHTSASATPSSSVTPGSHIKGELSTHHGNDAALDGAGLATAGGLHHSSQRDEGVSTGPASKTIGPHSSNIANILDPRVQPDPAKQKSHNLSKPHQSDTLGRQDPNVDKKAGYQDQHHHGRDAAVAGGAGITAYEAAKAYGDHRSTQPEASMMNQRYDPTAAGAHASNPTPAYAEYNYNEPRSDNHSALIGDQHSTGLTGKQHGTSGLSDTRSSEFGHDHNNLADSHSSHLANQADPRVDSDRADEAGNSYSTHSSRDDETYSGAGIDDTHSAHDNSSRNAALGAGVGAAALSGAVFTGTTHHDSARKLPDSENPVSTVASSAAPVPISNYQQWQPMQSEWPTSYTMQEPSASSVHPMEGLSPYNSGPVTEQNPDGVENLGYGNHNKRNVAFLGTAGAATLASAGHAHHDASQPVYDSPASSTYPTYDSAAISAHPTQGTSLNASHVPVAPATQQRYDNVETPESRGHDNGNSALLSTAGVAALAGTGYAHHNANQPTYNSSAPSAHPKNDSSATPIHQTRDSSTTPIHPTLGTTSHASQIPAAPATHQRHDAEDMEDRGHDKNNAALLGTTGAAALAGTRNDHPNVSQPTQNSTAYATYDSANTAVHSSQAVSPYDTQAPDGIATQQRHNPVQDSERQAHDKRNAALLGTAGAATVLGAGHAYHNTGQHGQDSTLYGSQAPPTSVVRPTATEYNTKVPADTTTHHRYDSVGDSTQKDHNKHDTTLLGTAGAATAAGAGYAYAHRQDQKNLLETQERLAKMEKQHEKEQAKLEKDTYKQQEKDQHKLDKERAKLQKSHPEDEEKEKKHGILGFLHRDKSKKEKSSPSAENTRRASRDYSHESPRHSKDFLRESPRHSREYPDPRTTAGAYEDLPIDVPGRNKLHKDPPKGHPAREALEHPEVFASGGLGKREHIGVDGPIGHPDLISGDRETQRNTYGAHAISDLDRDMVVTEPYTGLPMNVGRYGDGRGGTDASATIQGAHLDNPAHAAESSTNWEGVKKADTAY